MAVTFGHGPPLPDSLGVSALALCGDALRITPGVGVGWQRTASLAEMDQHQAAVALRLRKVVLAGSVSSFGWESWREQSLWLALAGVLRKARAAPIYWRLSCALEQVCTNSLSKSRALHSALGGGTPLYGFWTQLTLHARFAPETLSGASLEHWPEKGGWRLAVSRDIGEWLRVAYARGGGLVNESEPTLSVSAVYHDVGLAVAWLEDAKKRLAMRVRQPWIEVVVAVDLHPVLPPNIGLQCALSFRGGTR